MWSLSPGAHILEAGTDIEITGYSEANGLKGYGVFLLCRPSQAKTIHFPEFPSLHRSNLVWPTRDILCEI